MSLQTLIISSMVIFMVWDCADCKPLEADNCPSKVLMFKSLAKQVPELSHLEKSLEEAGYDLCDLLKGDSQQVEDSIKRIICQNNPDISSNFCEDQELETPSHREKRRTRSTISSVSISRLADLFRGINQCLMIGSGMATDGLTQELCLILLFLSFL